MQVWSDWAFSLKLLFGLNASSEMALKFSTFKVTVFTNLALAES